MTQIGAFTRKEDGFFGRVRTLVFDAEVSILPIDESDTENAPNHRVFCNGMEVGAAWDRTGDRAGAYLSVTIDDPILNQPIRARLFESDTKKDVWNLLWTRRKKQEGEGDGYAVPALARPFSCNPLDRSSAHQSPRPDRSQRGRRAQRRSGASVSFPGARHVVGRCPSGKRQPAAQPCP